jgi:diguanylate cyclase
MSESHKSSLFYPILQDYADWSSQIIRATFYPEKILKSTINAPRPLGPKLAELSSSHQISQAVIDEFLTRQTELHAHVDTMLKIEGRPELEVFDKFLALYDDFSQRLDRFDVDSMLADFGVDTVTGLRNATVLIPDLERELERRARRGHPFSVVIGQVDNPDPAKMPEQIKLIAKGLRICMRSFDDAYLSGKNEFLVSLKQTDNAGALRFVERLKDVLANHEATFTMSFCAAEPMPGDDMNALLANVRNDLKELASQSSGEAVEYEEISPLQRFVKSITKTDKK